MKRLYSILLGMILGFGIANSFADESVYGRKFSVGIGISGGKKANGTEGSYTQISPEFFGYSYSKLTEGFILRPGLRLAYVGGQEPQSASAVAISESDFKSTAEASLLWVNRRNTIVPAFTVGGGTIYRSTSLKTIAPVVSSSQSLMNGSRLLPFVYTQVSMIIPIAKGEFELAPFGRYNHIFSDSRIDWQVGVEATVSLY